MLTDIKSGLQLVIFLVFLAAFGYFASQAIPAITQATTLPARIEAENNRLTQQSRIEQAQVSAQVVAIPTMQALVVKATEVAIDNERTKAQAAANAQVVAAQGSADLNRSIGDAVRNAVLGIFGTVAAFLIARAVLGMLLIHRAENHGGGVSVLPSGETRYFPAPRQDQKALQSGERIEQPTRKRARARVRVEKGE